MVQLEDLRGVKRKKVDALLIVKNQVQSIRTALFNDLAVTAADSNGCFNIWKDDEGNIRGEKQVYYITKESKIFPTVGSAVRWATLKFKEIA